MFASILFFFFQAEDGIRDKLVTGVQTCALPISITPGHVQTPPPQGYPPQPGYAATPPPGYAATPPPQHQGYAATPQPGPHHPLSIYDTPMPIGMPPAPAPGWDEDSSDLVRQGVSRGRPGLATPPPGPYPSTDARTVPVWVLAAAFVAAVGVGFAITI